MIRDVTDLDVYNLALNNLEALYKLIYILPPEYKKIRLQTHEAAEKIPPQIAEGFGKKKAPKEFCRFLLMALGSSDEVITHIREIKIIAKSFSRIQQEECDETIEKYKLLSKKLNRLHTVWQKFS